MLKEIPLTIRLDPGDFEALEAIAQAERTSISAVIRRAVVRELKKHQEVLEAAEKAAEETKSGRRKKS